MLFFATILFGTSTKKYHSKVEQSVTIEPLIIASVLNQFADFPESVKTNGPFPSKDEHLMRLMGTISLGSSGLTFYDLLRVLQQSPKENCFGRGLCFSS